MLGVSGFFKYSIYIGHSSLNSIILSSWFFYKLRKKIWIINLFKTIIFLKLVFKFLKYISRYNLPFWFINLELSKEFLFKKYALECGEFACTKIWIRGFLSNFKSIQNSIGKYILKKHILKISKKKYLIDTWGFTRFSWPRGIFLSDITSNYVICKEAGTISLPVVALIDTNVKSYLFNYPIPSNDDSLNSINYILSLISKKLLLYKYRKVINWYNKYKIRYHKLLNKISIFNKKLNNFFENYVDKIYDMYDKEYLSGKFLNEPYMYSQLNKKIKRHWHFKLLFNKNVNKMLFANIFYKYAHFLKNCNLLTQNIFRTIGKSKFNIVFSNNNLKKLPFFSFLKKKLNFLNKINILKNSTKKFLYGTGLKLKQKPLYLLKRTIKLKKKNKQKKNIYLLYYFISNFLRKSRVFHETFFFNKPSPYVYLRAFHKYNYFYYNNKYKYDNSRFQSKKDYWYAWDGYRYKIDYRAKLKFLKKKYNMMLFKFWKYNKKLTIADSALLFDLEKWVTYSRKAHLMTYSGRLLLKYWLYPFFRRYNVKDNYRWYHSKFFYKEDVQFKQHFHWKVNKSKTPLTTFHFYNNWFSFLFKYKRVKKHRVIKGFDFDKKPVDPRAKYLKGKKRKIRNVKN